MKNKEIAPRVGLEFERKPLIGRAFFRTPWQVTPKAYPEIVCCGETLRYGPSTTDTLLVVAPPGIQHESSVSEKLQPSAAADGCRARHGKIECMEVVVNMPDPVARQWGDTPQAIGRHVVEDAVIERYRSGRLSQRQAGEALGLDYWQTEAFLRDRGVPVNYSVADLEADEAALAKISQGS